MWVIGNGESRLAVDINKLEDKKIGCNAIFRDYDVDYLVCVDRRMVREARIIYTGPLYTRPDWRFINADTVPELPFKQETRADEPMNWGSGPYAVFIACTLDTDIKLLGFDLYGVNTKVNNVYKGTNGYVDEQHHQIDPRYWIYQISKCFKHFPKHKFTVYQSDDWDIPESWLESNVTLDKISSLV